MRVLLRQACLALFAAALVLTGCSHSSAVLSHAAHDPAESPALVAPASQHIAYRESSFNAPASFTVAAWAYDPDGIQAVSDALPILAVEATWAPHGITVRDIYLKTDASSTYSVDLEEWTAMLSPTVTSIEVVATSASAEGEDDGTLADASVAAGSIVFVDLPSATANFITVSFTYTINPGN